MDNVFEQVEKNIDSLVLGSADWTASASKEELEAAALQKPDKLIVRSRCAHMLLLG